jgi:hypothetical protein
VDVTLTKPELERLAERLERTEKSLQRPVAQASETD